MTFKATNQIQSDGLTEAKRLANAQVAFATEVSASMAAAAVSANRVIQVHRSFQRALDRWNAIKAIPGILQYARDQEDDQIYDVVVEFNAMIAAAEVVRDRVELDVPTDGSGFLLLKQFDAGHDLTTRDFTTAQTAQLRTDLNSFIATVS